MSTQPFCTCATNHRRWPALVRTIALTALCVCSTYEPAPFEAAAGFLPPPNKVVVKVGNGVIDLSWFYEDTSLVKEYRVYRLEDGERSFRRIAATRSLFCRDDQLTNGIRYQYQIAALSKSNVEGEHSKTVAATPSIYSILLAGGAKYTNARTITVTVTAPQNTALMMLSNDASFPNASWEPFAATRAWGLTFGDGAKMVYAKFRTADDQEINQASSAGIILDTVSTVQFLEEDSRGKNLTAPDKLHIRLGAGEVMGKATAEIYDVANSINGQEPDIRLYDDGTNGDRIPDDGIYETDYFIRQGLETINAYVYGTFTDAAGNVSPRATAPSRVTIQSPPMAVVLQEPTILAGEATSLSLRWTPNTDNDFVSYQLRRSLNYIVSTSSVLVKEFVDADMTNFVDSGLAPATTYYYRVYVYDTAGNNSGSNIVEAMTPLNERPKPVVLSQPVADTLALKLSWSPSTESDFANYRLYRSTSSPVDTSYAPITIINSQAQTAFSDFSAVANVLYYYQLFVFDRFGLRAGSNEVQGRRSR
jgi:fibronectin type 3 domain-containing protein